MRDENASCPSGSFYTIKKGDTLSGIAGRCGVGMTELLNANPYLDPAYIEIGQCIILPRGTTLHTVADGEQLFDILRRYDVSAAELRQANPDIDILALKEKDVLQIPVKLRSGSYTVAEGDTLPSIAARFGVSITSLLKANPELRPDEFLPGQSIRV